MLRDQLVKVLPEVREAVFRGAMGTEKYNQRKVSPTPLEPMPIDDTNTSDEEDETVAGKKGPDTEGKVPFWYMEMHPRVMAELLWEGSKSTAKGGQGRVLLDFSTGPSTLAWTGLNMGMKVVMFCHNQAHIDASKAFLCDQLKQCIKHDDLMFTPKDKDMRMAEMKPPRLLAFEKHGGQQKRPGDTNAEQSDKKRQALGTSMEDRLDVVFSCKAQSPKVEIVATSPEAKNISGASQEDSKGSPGQTQVASATPSNADLANMLSVWGAKGSQP
jgi:hypothetical protein